jgi:hydrogenase maturation protease
VKLLILGIGSPFGQDSLGWQAIDGLVECGLQQRLACHEVFLQKADRPGALLLEHMRGMDVAILIDALIGGDEPGRVHSLTVEETAQGELALSGHDLGVAGALALGDALGDLPERVLVLGVEVAAPGDCAPGSPSPGVGNRSLDGLVNQILEVVPAICAPQPAPG